MNDMIDLRCGDCLEIMKEMPEKSIDFILTDPPYGTTSCKWDNIIPFEPMWKHLKRVIKPNSVICLFGKEPFLSRLIVSNIQDFKYKLAWKKSLKSGFVNAKLKPLNTMEYIAVFSEGTTANGSKRNMPYYPQGLIPTNKIKKRKLTGTYDGNTYQRKNSKECKQGHLQKFTNYPTDFIEFANPNNVDHYHPTQKPICLLEYLINTYTNIGETVLDFTMGSGSTGVACVNTGRNFIGIELDDGYFQIAKERIENCK